MSATSSSNVHAGIEADSDGVSVESLLLLMWSLARTEKG